MSKKRQQKKSGSKPKNRRKPRRGGGGGGPREARGLFLHRSFPSFREAVEAVKAWRDAATVDLRDVAALAFRMEGPDVEVKIAPRAEILSQMGYIEDMVEALDEDDPSGDIRVVSWEKPHFGTGMLDDYIENFCR